MKFHANNIFELTNAGQLSSSRTVGSEGNWAVITYIYTRMREYGYNVTLEPVNIKHELVHSGGLWVQDGGTTGDFKMSLANGAVYSPAGKITGVLYSISPAAGCDMVRGVFCPCESSNVSRSIFLQRREERLFYCLEATVRTGKRCSTQEGWGRQVQS